MNYFEGRMNGGERCPKCGERRVRSWDEMEDDERDFVHRMFRPDEAARRRHKWCVLCWEELSDDEPHLV